MKQFKAVICLVTCISFIISCKNEKKNTEYNDPVFSERPVADLTQQIETNPKDAALYFKRGLVLARLNKDSLALNDLNKAVSLDSTKAEYFSAIGDLLFEHKDLNGSVKWIKKALELNPEDVRSHLKLAKMFLYLGEHGSAFTEINTVLRQDVYNGEAYFLKGMVYKDLNDTAKAISSFLTAVQVQPEQRESVVQLGLMYSAKKDPLALQYFDNAYRMDTTDLFPIFAKGVYYQNKGDYNTAKDIYRTVIYKDSEYLDAYFNTGYILIQQDSLEKAWRQYDLLTKLSPANAEAYYNRGFCSELMKNKEAAVADYKQALVFDENYDLPKEGLKRIGK